MGAEITWLGPVDGPTPFEQFIAAGKPATVPVAVEYCDSHPTARAVITYLLQSGELAFCGHCYRAHGPSLTDYPFALHNLEV